MSKDYKKADRSPGARATNGSLLVGILIGLVLGLGIALAVAWYINRMPSPFLARPAAPTPSPSTATAQSEGEKGEAAGSNAATAKPRFDFYKILPGEQATPDPKASPVQQAPLPAAAEKFFLQAGAFQNAPDADNLKARLALLGIDATIQTTTLPDKGVWHRVRVGPYASVEELNKARETLKQNGYDTALVKVPDPARQQ